ncbi:hypothetical protein STEG23_019354, partial [Scotinomys teguina]
EKEYSKQKKIAPRLRIGKILNYLQIYRSDDLGEASSELWVSLCSFGAFSGTHSVAQTGLELTEIHLPVPPEFWYYRLPTVNIPHANLQMYAHSKMTFLKISLTRVIRKSYLLDIACAFRIPL